MRLEWFLAQRFRQQQISGVGRFIKYASVTGIALGCAVLIVLSAVLNGFEIALKERLLASIPHGQLSAVETSGLADARRSQMLLKQREGVANVFIYSESSAMLQQGAGLFALQLMGLSLADNSHPLMAFVTRYAQDANEDERTSAAFPAIILGHRLIEQHGLQPGQIVEVLLPSRNSHRGGARLSSHSDSAFGSPQSVLFTLRGAIKVGGEADSVLGLVELSELNDVLGLAEDAQGLQLFYDDPFVANQLTFDIGYNFNYPVYMSDWTRTHGHLYQDILLVKMIVYVVLTLVIAVACFNIVVTLVMTVKHKQKHIAILKTMGLGESSTIRVFILAGMQTAVKGVIIGLLVGVGVAAYLSDAMALIQSQLDTAIISSDVYFVDALPSQINWSDVLVTGVVALVLAFLATLYPAKQAAAVAAARHLH